MKIALNSTELKPGCCVVINDVEQPCAKLIAVVKEIVGSSVTAVYLRDGKELKPYRNGFHGRTETVTPISRFGVKVLIDDGLYWCEVVGDSTATYEDGKPRRWQDYQGVVKRQSNSEAERIALRSIVDDNQERLKCVEG